MSENNSTETSDQSQAPAPETAAESPNAAQAPAETQRAVTPDDAPPADALEAAKAETQRVRDQLLRTAADFDNFRKRTRREISDAERRTREDMVRELLPVFDNLERAVAHAETATDVKALADGLGLVMRQFLDTLGRLGIERLEAQGKPFDPTFHEAVQHFETADHAPGTVVTEVQAGYKHGDRLVRPSLVVVAKAPAN